VHDKALPPLIADKKSAPLISFAQISCSIGLLFFSSTIFSQPGDACQIPSGSFNRQAPPTFSKDELDNVNISADQTLSDSKGNSTFQGNVIIEKHELRISADSATYSPTTEDININGNVHVDTNSMTINADIGLFSKSKQHVFFKGVEFQINDTLRGKAASIIAAQETNSELSQTTITSCDLNDPDWRLNADNIRLNHKEEYGSADNVVLRFMEVPFLYIPYMEFPIGDRRRSGLLVPEAGYSSSRGGELTLPWYWNIAPNHDAILAPHFMSHRGTQLDAQYRFLTESTSGQFDTAYLNNDKITGENRYHLEYKQHTRFTSDLNMNIDIQDTSDTEYFNDFSNNLSTASVTHLNRKLELNYNKQYWRTHLLAQSYETLDTNIAIADRPYRRLPQLTLQGDQPITDSGLAFTLVTEWVDFAHEDDSTTTITGSRLQFMPGLHWLTEGSFWFIDPAIKFSHAQYDVVDGTNTQQNIEDRNLTISSLDAGLFFERDLDSGLIQTLEPRIYYLYVPYRDQSQFPNFDTAASVFSTALLFRDNRFNGGDRIGDANQLTLALSSRFISSTTGSEYFRASIGQISYFEDRLVSLTGTIDNDNKSDIIGELAANLNNWSLSASTQWDTDKKQSQRDNFLLHYQSDSKHIFNLGLRNDRSIAPEIRQTDLSFLIPIYNQLSVFSRWNYSLEHNHDIEVIGGISYDSCCWSLQLMAQRRLTYTNNIEEYDNAFMVQLVLKGLGSVSGNKVRNTLEHAILGYKED